ncbi:MAG: S8 family serine peptidase [bacterium]
MNYYPIELNLEKKRCLVIGGGKVAERKAISLLTTGASVCIISPKITKRLKGYVAKKKIEHIEREYVSGDIKDTFLVIGATDDEKTNIQIAKDCRNLGILVNIVDSPLLSNFLVPATVVRGKLVISIGTSGNSPALAKKIKEEIGALYGPEYGELTELLGDLRQKVHQKINSESQRKLFWEKLINSDLLSLIKKKEKKKIEELVQRTMKTLIALFLLLPTLTFSNFVPGDVLVKFRETGQIKGYGILSKVFEGETDELGKVYKLKTEIGKELEKISELKKDLNVVYAEPNYIRHIYALPNDTYFDNQWGLEMIEAEAGWDIEKGTEAVIIAITDTGIDYNHIDLKDKVIGSQSFVSDEPDPMDGNGHGTHVAGIAAASTNNGTGTAGVAWGCKILAVKVLNSNGYGEDAWCVQAIKYATDYGARVINMSWGSDEPSNILKDALDYAYNKGVLLIAAAGNDGTSEKIYPGGYENVLSVAATNSNDKKAWFSNYGSWVDIAAPGQDIYSTIPNNKYASFSGTSMATPFVSGLAGLLFSRYGAITFGSITYFSDNIGRDDFGRINLPCAILQKNRQPTPPTLSQPADEGFSLSLYPKFKWTKAQDPDWSDKITYTVFLNERELAKTKSLYWEPLVCQKLTPNMQYTWRVLAEDIRGGTSSSQPATFTTSEFDLYPNPAKQGATVYFRGLPIEREGTYIKIYTVAGELVKKIPVEDGRKAAWQTSDVASGVYLYTLSDPIKIWASGKIAVIK